MRQRFIPLAGILLGGLLLSTWPMQTVFAQGADATASAGILDKAQSQYDQAKFMDAIATLRAAISTSQLSGPDLRRGRELIARALVKSGQRLEAKDAFLLLLRSDGSYSPDPSVVPPDEMQVYELARREFDAEKIESGARIPASIALLVGLHGAAQSDLSAHAKTFGGGEVDEKPEVGGSVRFPLRDRLALDLELMSLSSTLDSNDHLFFFGNIDFDGKAGARVLAANLYWTWLSSPKSRLHVFVGSGALRSELRFNPETSNSTNLFARELSPYGQAGAEGEYLVHPRIGLTLRGLGRYALSKKHNYGTPAFNLTDQRVDYRGWAAQLGVRAYIGY